MTSTRAICTMRLRLHEIIYHSSFYRFLAQQSPHLPALPLPPPPPPPPPKHKGKIKSPGFRFFFIHLISTTLPAYLPPSHPRHHPHPQPNPPTQHPLPPPIPPPKKNGFGFFVKIHLLESLKLELYDLYFRSYSFMIIFGNMDCI